MLKSNSLFSTKRSSLASVAAKSRLILWNDALFKSAQFWNGRKLRRGFFSDLNWFVSLLSQVLNPLSHSAPLCITHIFFYPAKFRPILLAFTLQYCTRVCWTFPRTVNRSDLKIEIKFLLLFLLWWCETLKFACQAIFQFFAQIRSVSSILGEMPSRVTS